MRRFALSVILATGCASGPSDRGGVELLSGFDPGPAPANGMQVVLPIIKGLNAGDSFEYCSWTDKILDQDIDIKASKSVQSLSGHHAVLFYTKIFQPPGTTRLCTDDDMATFRFGGVSGENEETTAPGDLVWRIPAGAQIVVNHHYLNATNHALDAQSAITLTFADPNANKIPSGAIAFVDSSMKIGQGDVSLDVGCTITREMQLWDFFPHMHKWGRHVNVDHTSAGVTNRLFDLEWQEEYTFHSPELRRDVSNPYLFKVGDQVNVHCEWQNDSGKDLSFGLEMCVAFGQTINTASLGNIACDKGVWTDF